MGTYRKRKGKESKLPQPQTQTRSDYVSAPITTAGDRDNLIKQSEGLGWRVLRGCADQDGTVRLLRAAARRVKLGISTNIWSMDGIVTFKVTSK